MSTTGTTKMTNSAMNVASLSSTSGDMNDARASPGNMRVSTSANRAAAPRTDRRRAEPPGAREGGDVIGLTWRQMLAASAANAGSRLSA